MDADRLLADEQALADLAVRPALRDQGEDLVLAARQPERVRPGRLRLADDARGRAPTAPSARSPLPLRSSCAWPGPDRRRAHGLVAGRCRRRSARRRRRGAGSAPGRRAPAARAASAAPRGGSRSRRPPPGAARARPGPTRPSPLPRSASASRQRARATAYGLPSAAHASASCRPRRRIVAALEPGPVAGGRRAGWRRPRGATRSHRTRPTAARPPPPRRRPRAVRVRALASTARSRPVRASAPAVASTSATVAAIFAIRLQSSESWTSSQPRSAARRASTWSLRHSANEAAAR